MSYRIIVELGTEVLFDQTIRDSYFQMGGQMRKNSEQDADTRAMQNEDFFASVIEKTVQYDVDCTAFAGFHGIRLTTTDVMKPVAVEDGTDIVTYPYPAGEVFPKATTAYTPAIFAQGIMPDGELFFVGSSSVSE